MSHLKLVTPGFQKLVDREKLIAKSKLLYPHSKELAARWVEAKLTLGSTLPKTRVGAASGPAMFPRTTREARW